MIHGTLFPIYFIDAPAIFNAGITNIPGSGSLPIQVVASSGLKGAYGVTYIDTTGEWIGLYTGSIGSEILRCIIGGGNNSSTSVVIASNSRVSLRSMTTQPITLGEITITFLGQGLGGG